MFVWIAGGLKKLMSREKMETYYQRKNQLKDQNQQEPAIPSVYRRELSPKDKEIIFKDIYDNIKLFNKLVYEARKQE